MKFCPKCGEKVEGMKFCPECGCKIEDTSNKDEKEVVDSTTITIDNQKIETPHSKKKPRIGCIIGLIIIALFIFGVVVGINEMSKNPEKYETTQENTADTEGYMDLAIQTLQTYNPDANIHIMDYKEWEVDGIIYIQSTFDTGSDIDHEFLIRCPKDGTQVFILQVDGDTIFYNQDDEIEYMDNVGKSTTQNKAETKERAKTVSSTKEQHTTASITPHKQNLIIGMWEGDWISGGYIEFQFLDNGEFYCSTYYDGSSNSTNGTYWVEDNNINLDTGEIYPVQSVQNGLLKLETYEGVYELHAVSV